MKKRNFYQTVEIPGQACRGRVSVVVIDHEDPEILPTIASVWMESSGDAGGAHIAPSDLHPDDRDTILLRVMYAEV